MYLISISKFASHISQSTTRSTVILTYTSALHVLISYIILYFRILYYMHITIRAYIITVSLHWIPAQSSALLAEMTQMWLARVIVVFVFLRVGAIKGPLVVRVPHVLQTNFRSSMIYHNRGEVSVYSVVVSFIRRFLLRVHPNLIGTYITRQLYCWVARCSVVTNKSD